MTPTTAQARVLAWMVAYPHVRLNYTPGDRDERRVRWSAWWASESAREHMVGTMSDLGGVRAGVAVAQATHPVSAPLDGPTPRITPHTLDALADRGWVKIVSHSTRPSAPQWHYAITPAGRAAVEPADAPERTESGA